MNIRFEYEYRDAGNYKNGDDIVFANRNNMSADALTAEVRQALISTEFFVAEDVGIRHCTLISTTPRWIMDGIIFVHSQRPMMSRRILGAGISVIS